ncbi:thioesterase family protein [Amycolatopsis sp. 195334CR]|uniref:thioesterase family protein n=1 Tax=Amycolatopsis sp. 195334CR TaxID=2814588 RepID=UPI001A8CA0B4|nr:thioesterase family protein [Amycolatopsis sp. 195334CR]MBN6036605.1 thioesterase family protein [Amycolatopsis sp. 195334CR]
MGNFQEATALVRRSETEFDAELDPQWSVGGKLHGGYLLAVLGRATAELAPAHPHLTAVSGSFSAPPDAGAAQVTVEVLRAGRGVTQLRARLAQDGKPRVEALVTQGLLDEADPWWSGIEPIDIPPEEDCVPAPARAPGAGFTVDLMNVVEQRLDPRVLGFTVGKPARGGVISSWQRLADGADWDPLSLLVGLDPVPPVSYDLGLSGWAPTVQFSAYVRRLPAPGPIRVRMTAGDVGGNRMDEVAHAFDSKDRLVAQAMQIAGVRH